MNSVIASLLLADPKPKKLRLGDALARIKRSRPGLTPRSLATIERWMSRRLDKTGHIPPAVVRQALGALRLGPQGVGAMRKENIKALEPKRLFDKALLGRLNEWQKPLESKLQPNFMQPAFAIPGLPKPDPDEEAIRKRGIPAVQGDYVKRRLMVKGWEKEILDLRKEAATARTDKERSLYRQAIAKKQADLATQYKRLQELGPKVGFLGISKDKLKRVTSNAIHKVQLRQPLSPAEARAIEWYRRSNPAATQELRPMTPSRQRDEWENEHKELARLLAREKAGLESYQKQAPEFIKSGSQLPGYYRQVQARKQKIGRLDTRVRELTRSLRQEALKRPGSMRRSMALVDKASGYTLNSPERAADRKAIKELLHYAGGGVDNVYGPILNQALRAASGLDPEVDMHLIRQLVAKYKKNKADGSDPLAALDFSMPDYIEGQRTKVFRTLDGGVTNRVRAARDLKALTGSEDYPFDLAHTSIRGRTPYAKIEAAAKRARDQQAFDASSRGQFINLNKHIAKEGISLGTLKHAPAYLFSGLSAGYEGLMDGAATASEWAQGARDARKDPDYEAARHGFLSYGSKGAGTAAGIGIAVLYPGFAAGLTGAELGGRAYGVAEAGIKGGWKGFTEKLKEEGAEFIRNYDFTGYLFNEKLTPAERALRAGSFIFGALGAKYSVSEIREIAKNRSVYKELLHLFPDLKNESKAVRQAFIDESRAIEDSARYMRAYVKETSVDWQQVQKQSRGRVREAQRGVDVTVHPSRPDINVSLAAARRRARHDMADEARRLEVERFAVESMLLGKPGHQPKFGKEIGLGVVNRVKTYRTLNETGVPMLETRRILEKHYAKHILDRHGDPVGQAKLSPPQVAIRPSDFQFLKVVGDRPDHIIAATRSQHGPRIASIKRTKNGTWVTIEEVRGNSGRVAVISAWHYKDNVPLQTIEQHIRRHKI